MYRIKISITVAQNILKMILTEELDMSYEKEIDL